MLGVLYDSHIYIRVEIFTIAIFFIDNVLIPERNAHISNPIFSSNMWNIFNPVYKTFASSASITKRFAFINCNIVYKILIAFGGIICRVLQAGSWEMDVIKSDLIAIIRAYFNPFLLAVCTISIVLWILKIAPFLLLSESWFPPVFPERLNVPRCVLLSPAGPISSYPFVIMLDFLIDHTGR